VPPDRHWVVPETGLLPQLLPTGQLLEFWHVLLLFIICPEPQHHKVSPYEFLQVDAPETDEVLQVKFVPHAGNASSPEHGLHPNPPSFIPHSQSFPGVIPTLALGTGSPPMVQGRHPPVSAIPQSQASAFSRTSCLCWVRIIPAPTPPTRRRIPKIVAIILPPPNFFLGVTVAGEMTETFSFAGPADPGVLGDVATDGSLLIFWNSGGRGGRSATVGIADVGGLF